MTQQEKQINTPLMIDNAVHGQNFVNRNSIHANSNTQVTHPPQYQESSLINSVSRANDTSQGRMQTEKSSKKAINGKIKKKSRVGKVGEPMMQSKQANIVFNKMKRTNENSN